MRDLAAILLAITLVFFALRLATSLTRDRRQRKRTRLSIEATGQIILAEVPSEAGGVRQSRRHPTCGGHVYRGRGFGHSRSGAGV